MGAKLKKFAVESGYGDGVGSQLIAKIDVLEQRIQTLEAALRQISELEFCNVYEAAVIAREALKEGSEDT